MKCPFQTHRAYLSISSPPVEAGGLKPTLRVLPSTASRVTLEGGSLGCGRGMAYGVSATAEGPATAVIHTPPVDEKRNTRRRGRRKGVCEEKTIGHMGSLEPTLFGRQARMLCVDAQNTSPSSAPFKSQCFAAPFDGTKLWAMANIQTRLLQAFVKMKTGKPPYQRQITASCR